MSQPASVLPQRPAQNNSSPATLLLAFPPNPELACLPMRLLDRYLLRELLIPFVYCMGGILIFWISADLFSELNEFQRNHLKGLEVVQYYVVLLPEMLVFPLLPIVLLLA